MKSNSTYSLSITFKKPLKGFSVLLVALLAQCWTLSAQVLINPAAEGGFEVGTTFASNGWTVAATNSTQRNKWFVGTAPGIFSNRAAYISKDDDGANWIYADTTSAVHFYRNVTFTAGVPTFTLSFDWAAQGKPATFSATNDELWVSIAPLNYTPTNSSIGSGGLTGSAINLGRFRSSPSLQHVDILINRNLGNCTFPAKWRLIFTWVNSKSFINFPAQNPPAAVDNISLVANPISLTINHPPDQCEGLGDITYTASPAPSGSNTGVFSSSPAEAMVNYEEFCFGGCISYGILYGPPYPLSPGQATFLASVAPPNDYTILYTYTTPNCVFEVSDEITIIGPPSATLEDRVVDCVDTSEVIDLKVMFTDDDGEYTTPGGTWMVNGVSIGQDSTLVAPQTSTCYDITYTASINGCGTEDTDTKKLLVEIKAHPEFTIDNPDDSNPASGAGIFGCEGSGASIDYIVQRTSTNDNYRWVVRKGDNVISHGLGDLGGTITIPALAEGQTVCYTVCLVEYGDEMDCTPGILDDIYSGPDYPNGYEPCADSICQTIILYNDGNCDNGDVNSTIFASTCDPDIFNPQFEVCETDPAPYISFGCFLIKVKIPYKIVKASLASEKCAIFCDETDFDVTYDSKNFFRDIPGFNTKLQDMSPVTKIICKVLNFCICIPGIIRYRPLASLGTWCDKTLATLVSEALEDLAGSAGSGGMVVADTDGDGTFDVILADYDGVNQPDADPVNVQNKMSKRGGIITIRNVTGWPFKATNTCGDPTSESLNLLDVLAPYIDLIPIAGPVINGVLAAAQCDIPLAFTDAADVRIPVINSSYPEFKNCPPTGYVFTNDVSCATAANWSIPIAEDGCLGENLTYVGRTDSTDASYFTGTPPPTFVVKDNGEGVYQTAGPIVGSVLPLGTYTVTYSAFSCRGVQTDCTFPISVTPGAPYLVCPDSLTVPTDVDQCQAVVTGIAPVSGTGCGTVINYSVDYPAGSGFSNVSTSTPYDDDNKGTLNDASGLSFPLGVTTVTYTLDVDLNGDGDVLDPGESQSCSFTITVFDAQRPTAECSDIEVKLDNTGNATVFAANANNGTPFLDGGSTDNCDLDPIIEIQKVGDAYGVSVMYNCTDVGDNFVNIKVTDASGNFSTCIGHVKIVDYLDGIFINLAPPELCLEANNPSQLNFANYLTITLPNGQHVQHADVPTNSYTQGSQGYFFITAFLPDSTSSADPGSISYDGVYTPGTGSGFVTLTYLLLPPGFVPPADSNPPFLGCFEIRHVVFELRQPLDMDSPECMCVQERERVVDLGIVRGGLEPYRIEYSGTRLDVDGDGIADDYDGIYTYDVLHGHNINDFEQDLGDLRVEYTTPVWSFTIVDARGCEIFRSGSCDNDDLLVGPSITCPASNHLLTTEEYVCESQYTWMHPVPSDNCAVTLFDYRITNPDGTVSGPFNLNALLYPPPAGNPPYPPSFFMATYDFELGLSVITYYAEDAQGNFITCSFQVTVSDDDPPHFINCPAPPVVQNAESGHCDAYVDFALPLATDNCSIPTVTKIDNTGLNTGSRFPVGTTILYWEAKDPYGNKDTCQIKVIVNDYWQVPILSCPANKLQDNDPWLCGAKVFNIPPTYSGPCKNNYGVTYSIFGDAALTRRKDCGVTDASGKFFDIGDSWVKYTVQNQPLLLITEVTQSGAIDRLEISNLGPANIDISCLEIKRLSVNPAADQTLGPVTMLPSLAGTILPVGGTQVFNFTFNGSANMPACYTISYMGTIFDEVSTNGYAGCNGFTGLLNGGDVIRKCEDDSDAAADWVLAENCYPLTIGAINPDLQVMASNGTKTSLQSIEPNEATCVFKVTIKDAEKPFCGKLTTPATTYNGPAIPNISAATCNRSTITIPAGNCIIGDIVFNRTGTATPLNSTMTLISPKGIKVVITEIPDDSLATLFAQKAEGIWTLDIVPFPGQTPTITGWSLTINCIAPFDVPNQVLPNQAGLCGAPFTWIHPFFVDNCFAGTISVAYTTTNAGCLPPSGPLLGTLVKGGYSNTQFFCVGTTQVTYTLTDAAGNTSTCGFSVTVNDVEKPNLVCPQQIFVNLNGGECGAFVNYAPALATDNCAVTDTTMTPPSGSWFEIGDHLVVIVVSDAAGNTRSCTFTVSVIEYIPTDFNLICNDLSHVSMDASCVFIVNADEVLEGNNYHCYEDYIITIKNQFNQPVGNVFGSADIGKTFTITVLDPETGNTCWSLLKIEDKLVPALTCPTNTTIACSESTEVSNTGVLVVKDCSTFTTVVDDEFADFGQCNSPRGQIVRTWIVTDFWGNQSSCSQIITITPFSLQAVDFPNDVTVNCESAYLNSNATSPDVTGRPSINGFAIGVGGLCTSSISYTDERFEICPGSYEILRTWKVRNTCFPVAPDNPISHVQVITVADNNGPAFVCPPTVTVSTDPFQCCSTAALPDMIVSEGCSHINNLEAKVTGTNPNNGNIITFTVAGHLEDFSGNNYWNPDTLAVFDYTQCVPVGTYDVRYKASDECGNTSFCFFQLKVADLVPPTVSCDQFTQVALGSDGMAIIPATVLNDGTTDNCCLADFEVRRMNSNDCTDTSFDSAVKFCCSDIGDTIMVVFRAFDCNDNYNDCMVTVLVEDKIKPTCQSPAQVVVNCENFDPSLWVYGKADVTDNCCLDDTKVYQGQAGLSHSVNYSLFDTVCNKGTITRTFRAFDCGGNSSSCTQRVIVTYLQDYFVKFPNDAIVTTCDGTGVYGEPIFFGEDCELLGVTFADEIFTVVPDACFKIERTWQIINWCTFNPNLPLLSVPNPNPNAITNHITNLAGPTVSACGTLPPWKSTVVKINPSDPLPGTDYCTFWGDVSTNGVPNTPPDGHNEEANGYSYKQIIKIIDGQAPTATYVVPDCSNQNWFTANRGDLWNESYWWDNGLQLHDLCEEPTDLCITATDACSGSNVNIEYLLFLDLDGNGTMETVINSVNTGIAGYGWNNVQFNNASNPNFSGGTASAFDERPVPFNQKWGFAIQETVVGNNKTACVRWNTQQQQNTYVTPELPHGTHKIKWLISDGCGNNKEYEYTFTVKDCKAPTVVCLNGLSVNIMPTGMIPLWASDFLQYTEDNCTPNPLKISIRKCGTGTGFPVDAFGNPILQVTFDCTELGTQCVELWAIDAVGNADYCETYVIVQDNLGNCPIGDHVNVTGALKTEMTDGVEEAIVNINGTSTFTPPYAYFDLTDAGGLYQVMNNVPLDATFTIAPEKDDNPLNGVTTYDLVLISKHILGIEPLNSPYKMIAADANKSGSITTFDIVEIRKLILGIYTELPNNTSWRFVDKTFAFPNVNNPFQSAFPEMISVAAAMSSQWGKDFAGVKIGDVNNTVVANVTMQAEERTAGTAIFDIRERNVTAGETFEVTFKSAQQLKGYQFTMLLNGLEAIGVRESDQVSAANFGLVFGNAATVSIDGAQDFTLQFRATKSGKLSEMLGVSGSITRAEAYQVNDAMTQNGAMTRLGIAFRFGGKTISGIGFELYQNQPNPFVNKTFVGFYLPEAAEATLSIFDESGRVVYQQKGQFTKGENSISLDRALINTTGLLYYKLETATDSATKKMIQAK